jgi:hypothetical protein
VGDLLLAALAQPGDDLLRMLLGPGLVVGVVEHAGDPEPFLVRGTARVPRRRGAHHELDGARVLAQRVRLRPFAELRPGLVAGDRHRPPGYRARV